MTQLYCEILGTGKPLILVHGWAMHMGMWREFAERLAESYQVVCVDLPGHGRSDKVCHFTLQDISTELIKIAPGQPCCWLGWSMGVNIVLEIARRYPDYVNSLILLSGNAHFTRTAEWPGIKMDVLSTFADNLHLDARATLLRFLSLQVSNLPEAKAALRILKKALAECRVPDAATLSAGLNILKHEDLRPALASLQKPVQIIMGGKDMLVPVEAGFAMQALKPDSKLHILEKTGHVPFVSHQQQVLSLISGFINEVP